MSLVCRKSRVLCTVMMLNILICILIGLSWNLGNGKGPQQKSRISSKRFWHQQTQNDSFWNREQQRLDFLHNPIIRSAFSNSSLMDLPDWLNDSEISNPCEPDHKVSRQIVDYNSLPQRFQDFLLYMRCRTHTMLINQPNFCAKKPFLLLAVKSLIPHFDRRQAIRETWGRAGVIANRTVVTVFLLGGTLPVDRVPDLMGVLHHEARIFKDLLQWDYRDTLFNLTLKEVLFHEWFNRYCPEGRFILKGDDDVFVNTVQVINFLEGLSEAKIKDFFIGDIIIDASPQRDQNLKYFIPESVFVGQYPPYAGGGGYLYSGQLALRLNSISQQVVLFPIDDVYTGMCLRKLGLVPEMHTGFRTFGVEEKYRVNPCVHKNLMLVHSRTPQEILKIWSYLARPELDCQ